jgi:hypothetical protein
MRLAYCLANNLSLDTQLKFASGEATLNFLRDRGFAAERQDPAKRAPFKKSK